MKYELHPACAAWPEMKPEELRELADDIVANGLRESITLTPDGLLNDGRNRALACEIAGVEPTTTIFHGDPWLYSLSRNKHRRHMTTDQIALVAAELAKQSRGGDRGNQYTGGKPSNEGLPIAEVAKTAGVPKTAIESARVVLRYGTSEEIERVRTGEARARKTADAVRSRLRRQMKPASADPLDEVRRALIEKCADGKPRTVLQLAQRTQFAASAIEKALARLGDAVNARAVDGDDEYWIEGGRDELLVRTGLLKRQPDQSAAEIASLRVENAYLRRKLADASDENERLKTALHEKVVEEVAAKLIASGKTQPTLDDVVMNALG
jgi:hypothetical protein